MKICVHGFGAHSILMFCN